MIKKNLAIYTGVVFLSLSSLYNFKLNRNVVFTEATEMNIEQESISKISLVAHRGFSSMEVGNSKEAIEASTNLDCVTGIEFDVRLTKDDKVVLSHGDSVKCDDNNPINISTSTLEQLEDIKLKTVNNDIVTTIKDMLLPTDMSCIRIQRMHALIKKTGTIVTLDETMDIIDDKKRMYIELKFNDNYEELSSRVVEVLESHPDSKFIIQGNDYQEMKQMQKMYPQYKYQIIINNEKELVYLDDNFDGYAIRYSLLDYNEVKQKIDEGKEISIWNINDFEEFDDIVDIMGEYNESVNYITDYPDCIFTKIR